MFSREAARIQSGCLCVSAFLIFPWWNALLCLQTSQVLAHTIFVVPGRDMLGIGECLPCHRLDVRTRAALESIWGGEVHLLSLSVLTQTQIVFFLGKRAVDAFSYGLTCSRGVHAHGRRETGRQDEKR